MVVVITDRQWHDFVDATGTEKAMRRIEADTGLDLGKEGDRFEARHKISTILNPWFASRTLAQAGKVLGRHRLCWGPYQTFRQLVTEDPRCSVANPLFAMVDQPGLGEYLAASHPLEFAVGRLPPRPAPIVGQHTEEVISETLGKPTP